MNQCAMTINEDQLIQRFNDEFAARADMKRLVIDRSTKLGDFRLESQGLARLWLRPTEVEMLARRNGLLTPEETVRFNREPFAGRAYAAAT